MKIVIFGVGKNWETLKDFIDLKEHEIVAFLDNYYVGTVGLQEKNEVQVISPSAFFNKNEIFDIILVTGIHYKEIKKQLVETYQVDVEKIACVEVEDQMSRRIVNSYYFYQKKMDSKIERIERQQKKSLYLQAKVLIEQLSKKNNIKSIHEVEFSVCSQWGEDGIIQWLIHHIPIKNKTFIEFGVENYEEANTRFLLENDNWSGMIMDGSLVNMDYVKKNEIYWRYDLFAKEAFITKDNINDLLMMSNFDSDLGLLSIDIDGNDYWILNEIKCMNPRILICEYNSVYGNKELVTIPYDANFYRTEAHYSNLYFGASIEAIKKLASEKGYAFIGTNSNGCNAFFVRNDLIKHIPENILLNSENVSSKFRESRKEDGGLSYLNQKVAREIIGNMPVLDVTNNRLKQISCLEI